MEGVFERIGASWEAYGPKVLGAIIILVIAYLAAILARWLLREAVDRIPFIKGANDQQPAGKTIGASLGSAAFWVVILIGMIQALDRLEMRSIVDPLQSMLGQILSFLPNIIAAVFLFAVFVIVATVLKRAVTGVLSAAQADALPERLGLASGPTNIAGPVGVTLSSIVILLGGIAALDVLNIDAISGPAIAMLNEVLTAIPNIVVAGLVIGVFYVIARFVSSLITRVLPSTGVDNAVAATGLLDGADKGLTATSILSKTAFAIIMLLGLIQGMQSLNFGPLTDALDIILSMGAQILFGSVIIFAGVLVSGVVAKAMAASGSGATDLAAKLVRYIIVVLSIILGVSRMGLDPSGAFITNAALIILVGASIGGGIAFGLGGKDWAAKQLDKWNG